MKIEIPGTGCAKGKTPCENVKKTIVESGKDSEVVKAATVAEIMGMLS